MGDLLRQAAAGRAVSSPPRSQIGSNGTAAAAAAAAAACLLLWPGAAAAAVLCPGCLSHLSLHTKLPATAHGRVGFALQGGESVRGSGLARPAAADRAGGGGRRLQPLGVVTVV